MTRVPFHAAISTEGVLPIYLARAHLYPFTKSLTCSYFNQNWSRLICINVKLDHFLISLCIIASFRRFMLEGWALPISCCLHEIRKILYVRSGIHKSSTLWNSFSKKWTQIQQTVSKFSRKYSKVSWTSLQVARKLFLQFY